MWTPPQAGTHAIDCAIQGIKVVLDTDIVDTGNC